MLIDLEIKRNADNGRIISVYTGKGLPRGTAAVIVAVVVIASRRVP